MRWHRNPDIYQFREALAKLINVGQIAELKNRLTVYKKEL
jgi:excinuclease UvrABC nuclease subunit